MLYKLWYAFGRIFNRNRIPRLPRGMLASKYTHVTPDERWIMARMGARDPIGVRVAMKRYGVNSPAELRQLLEHHKPERRIKQRIWLAVGRIVGGEEKDPHAEEIRKIDRQTRKSKASAEIRERVKTVNSIFNQKE